MIILDVKPYCHDCEEFDADVKRPARLYGAFGEVVEKSDTIIRCKHRNICESLCQHFREKKDDD